MKKILATGGNGMLAYDFHKYYKSDFDIILLGKKDCDVTSYDSIIGCIQKYKPDIILNCAAYTLVDDAEDIGNKQNYDINAFGTYLLAKASAKYMIEFITISTDYVFDGKKQEGYTKNDIPNPINAYGMAKYMGEKLALDINPYTKIIRTSWLYGGETYIIGSGIYPNIKNGIYKNFINTMLKLSETQKEIRVVGDQYGKPTSGKNLSDYIVKIIIEDKQKGGIFHFGKENPSSIMSWAEFAQDIFNNFKRDTKVITISSNDYITKAKRPHYSIIL